MRALGRIPTGLRVCQGRLSDCEAGECGAGTRGLEGRGRTDSLGEKGTRAEKGKIGSGFEGEAATETGDAWLRLVEGEHGRRLK